MHKPEQVVEMSSVTAELSQTVQIFSHFFIFYEELDCEAYSEVEELLNTFAAQYSIILHILILFRIDY